MEYDNLKQQYDQLVLRYDKLRQEVVYIVNERINAVSIPIHIIESRIKNYDSLLDKAKRLDLKTPLIEMNDVCGVRIICLFLSDLEQLERIVIAAFKVIKSDDKIASKAEEQFGYFSRHYVCRLPDSCSGPRYDDVKELQFEIQIRTITMHSWATISHYLDYKSPQAIPSELRKDFHALSGLFYVADSHFELFFRSSSRSRKQAERRIEQGSDLSKEEINLDTLTAFLRKKYRQREQSNTAAISELLQEIVGVGYVSLAELEKDLDNTKKAFDYYESKYPPVTKNMEFADVGVVRISLCIKNENFAKLRNESLGSLARYKEAKKLLQ